MPKFDVEVFKRLGSETWENKYTLESPDMATAVSTAPAFISFERSMHATNVVIDYVRVSTSVSGDHVFSTIPSGLPGLRFISGGQLPLWNVVRVDLLHSAFGAPGRKYYRLPLAEGETEDGIVGGSLISLIDGAYGNLFTDMPDVTTFLSDGTGQAVTGWAISARVQFRKLTRSRRKAAGSGLVVG